MSTLVRFGFQRLVVNDLETEAKFYQDAFGYIVSSRVNAEIKGRPFDEIIFTGEEGKVEFIVLAFSDDQPKLNPGATLSAFLTSDLDAVASRILVAGGTVHTEIIEMKRSSGVTRTAFYKDPEGHIFQVIEE